MYVCGIFAKIARKHLVMWSHLWTARCAVCMSLCGGFGRLNKPQKQDGTGLNTKCSPGFLQADVEQIYLKASKL